MTTKKQQEFYVIGCENKIMRDFEKTLKDFYFQNKDIANCVVVKSTGPFAIIFICDIFETLC